MNRKRERERLQFAEDTQYTRVCVCVCVTVGSPRPPFLLSHCSPWGSHSMGLWKQPLATLTAHTPIQYAPLKIPCLFTSLEPECEKCVPVKVCFQAKAKGLLSTRPHDVRLAGVSNLSYLVISICFGAIVQHQNDSINIDHTCLYARKCVS